MKINFNILFILIIILVKGGQSQTYYPFPDSSAVWRTDWITIDCLQSESPASQYQYLLSGDTIINGNNYVKVFRTGFISPFCNPVTPYSQPSGYQGAYRQNINGKKVFLMLPDSIHEILFYNFSLSAGDTLEGYFNLPGMFCNDILVVDFIDSVMVGNAMRKRIHTAGNGVCDSYFIEGIGSTHGLFESLISFEGGGQLECFTQNGDVLYKNDSLSDCQLISGVSIEEKKQNIKLYPNPANDYLSVQGIPEGAHINYEIYNSYAKIIKTGSCKKNLISITGIGNGLFLIKLYVDGEYLRCFKIISNQN